MAANAVIFFVVLLKYRIFKAQKRWKIFKKSKIIFIYADRPACYNADNKRRETK